MGAKFEKISKGLKACLPENAEEDVGCLECPYSSECEHNNGMSFVTLPVSLVMDIRSYFTNYGIEVSNQVQ